jgi:Na+/H+ antiporter NhaD/arsenite permease-like protein
VTNPFVGAGSAGRPPLWSLLPFVAYLLGIALLPLLLPRFWEKNRNKLAVALLAALPAAAFLLLTHGGPLLLESLKDYAVFMVLLAALFIISGGIALEGSLAGTPPVNTLLLAAGAVLASLIGTTGASMLLVRPLLRANEKRRKKAHLLVFFIFIVSNAGGLLTPLGDPPLFLGFLRGVPFFWSLRLWAPWALVNGLLLLVFNVLDRAILKKEEGPRPGSPREEVPPVAEPLRLRGGLNVLWLLGVLATGSGVAVLGSRNGWSEDLQKFAIVAGTAALTGLSLRATSKEIRGSNQFRWNPIVEVAVVFLGIFVTMVPATLLLEDLGKSGSVPMTRAWEFFWATGLVSSVLDNAPTYVAFASLACGVVGGQVGETIDPSRLDQLLLHPQGVLFLKALSTGSVFMGAITYVGNAPNLMVKAIAEENGVKMPGFFGYMGWSMAVLFPLFLLVTLLCFRG